MNNLIHLVSECNAQVIYNRLCENLLTEEDRRLVLRAMFFMPMLFDAETIRSSKIVKAHHVVAGVDDTERAYWYKVLPTALYIMNTFHGANKVNVPMYTRQDGGNGGQDVHATTARRLTRHQPTLPRVEARIIANEDGTLWRKYSYEKCADSTVVITNFDEDGLLDAGNELLNEADEYVIDYIDTNDQETDNAEVLFHECIYYDEDGRSHNINEGLGLSAYALTEYINDIEENDEEE